jgi:hypothetical protein
VFSVVQSAATGLIALDVKISSKTAVNSSKTLAEWGNSAPNPWKE